MGTQKITIEIPEELLEELRHRTRQRGNKKAAETVILDWIRGRRIVDSFNHAVDRLTPTELEDLRRLRDE